MADEMRAHLDMRVEDLVTAGTPRSEAERRARMEFGSIDGAKTTAGRRVASRLSMPWVGISVTRCECCAEALASPCSVSASCRSGSARIRRSSAPSTPCCSSPSPIAKHAGSSRCRTFVKKSALNALPKLISVPDFQDWHDQSIRLRCDGVLRSVTGVGHGRYERRVCAD